ncbi:MAG: hypothetical protein RIC52_09310, partial [Amphiplicatus sp.]
MRLDLLRDYDSEAAKAAKPIYRVGDKISVSDAGAPEELAALARLNGFQGEAGGVLVGDEGVLLGVGDDSDPFVAAAAAERLPEGDYVFAVKTEQPAADAAALGWLFGAYRFDRYKKQKPVAARLIAQQGVDVTAALRAAEATGLVRDLVNTPAGDMSPAKIEDETRQIAGRFGADIECIVGEELLARNFPMIHAVGRAAAVAPRLIDLTWGREDAPKVTIIGKGVAFD